MKIFNTLAIREIDKYTIENEPVLSIDLMERAAVACTDWILLNLDHNLKYAIFAGQGNNGGDGLAIARLLAYAGIEVNVYILKLSEQYSEDAQFNLKRLKEQGKALIIEIYSSDSFPSLLNCDVIIDSLFGTGLSRPLSGLASDTVKFINNSGKTVISIDIPSGLSGEDNVVNGKEIIVRADHTLTFQFPKLTFLFSSNEIYVGEWHILPIGLHENFIASLETPWYFTQNSDVSILLRKRSKFAHKGTFGHALMISGSYGKMGAAFLSSKACLKSGVGLLTVHIPISGYQIIQASLPEAMVSIDNDKELFSVLPDISGYSAIGVGPGIGTQPKVMDAFHSLLSNINKPIVIDADAINILGENKEWMNMIPQGSIITPHPKEFERLAGSTNNEYERLMVQISISQKYNVFIVLKGAYTVITCPDGNCYFNSTGNPGMATAGSGDVLTGMILSFLAQGYKPKDAAITGVFLHGLAGDLAARSQGEEAMIASDLIDHIGLAFNEIRKH